MVILLFWVSDFGVGFSWLRLRFGICSAGIGRGEGYKLERGLSSIESCTSFLQVFEINITLVYIESIVFDSVCSLIVLIGFQIFLWMKQCQRKDELYIDDDDDLKSETFFFFFILQKKKKKRQSL